MSKIINSRKINSQLENGFEVDTFCDYGIRKIIKIDAEFFIECDIYFNKNKDLMCKIDLNRHVGSVNGDGQHILDLMITERHLYTECISKQDRRNTNLLINESKNKKWLELITKFKEELNV